MGREFVRALRLGLITPAEAWEASLTWQAQGAIAADVATFVRWFAQWKVGR